VSMTARRIVGSRTTCHQYLQIVHLLRLGVSMTSPPLHIEDRGPLLRPAWAQPPSPRHQRATLEQAELRPDAANSGSLRRHEGQDYPLIGQRAADSCIRVSTSAGREVLWFCVFVNFHLPLLRMSRLKSTLKIYRKRIYLYTMYD
jgi:hypothetical protein